MNPSTKIILRRAPRGGLSSPQATYRGGQFITAAVWNAEKAKALADLPNLIASFGDDIQFLRRVYEQQVGLSKIPAGVLGRVEIIPPSTVEARMKARIREAYSRAFALGKRHAGNLTSINAEDAVAIKGVRLDEYGYLRQFLADMAEGAGTMPYERRADYYAKAARELFWLGFVLGDQSATRRLRWVMDPRKEHCRTCLTMAEKGPIKAASMAEYAKKGIVPNSGSLDCLGYACGCRLEDEKG